jgi:hypothetical protein
MDPQEDIMGTGTVDRLNLRILLALAILGAALGLFGWYQFLR